MTSDEIKNTRAGTIEFWLQELAYQVAVSNESTERFDQERKADGEADRKALAATLNGIDPPLGFFD